MSVPIETEERGIYYLIRIGGDFTVKCLYQVRTAVEEAIGIGHIYVAFDLTQSKFVDSGGIGLIANVNKRLVERGGAAYIIAVPKAMRSTMETSGLLPIVPELRSVQEADAQIG